MNITSKSLIIAGIITCGTSAAFASDEIATLDLSSAATELSFNAETGAWDKTYSEEDPTIDSQIFCFMHNAIADYQTWWGFTVSNSANNMPSDDYLKFQYSNMAKGGIALDKDGNILKNEYDAPVVSDTIPYLVAYYNAYMSERPVDMVFNDGLAHEVIGCYVNLNTYCYYTTLLGDNYCRPFTNGDNYTLTIHGIADDNSEKTLDVKLVCAENGMYTGSTGWSYVDLTPLGSVNELYFTVDSTDKGAWGMNTPGYFCLDKIMAKKQATTSVSRLAETNSLRFDRQTKTITAANETFIGVYNAAGNLVKSQQASTLKLDDLQHGVYVARCGDNALKIIL